MQDLLAAEMLQRKLSPPTVRTFIQGVFGRKDTQPNDIHRSISRLPFALAITTNFDTLLETACGTKKYTWRSSQDVFQAIRDREFTVVKTHGSVDEPDSLRLTRTEFRDIVYTGVEFNECLRALLTWNTVLFVGHSLRDTDLVHLIDEARVRFGAKFGKHYAILPAYEVDEEFKSYLSDVLSIECMTYSVDRSDKEGHTREVMSILRDLAGKVSKQKHSASGIGWEEFLGSRTEAAQLVLGKAVLLTGSRRGDVCLMRSDIDPTLTRVAVTPVKQSLAEPSPDSVIHTVFLRGRPPSQDDHIYLPNV